MSVSCARFSILLALCIKTASRALLFSVFGVCNSLCGTWYSPVSGRVCILRWDAVTDDMKGLCCCGGLLSEVAA